MNLRNYQCSIVLAGGLGTRLREVINDLPKPMAPIGNTPFLAYILTWLNKQGINTIIFSLGYKADSIIQYFGNDYKGMRILYSIEETPLGTGGAIKKALELVQEEYCYIVNGDTFFYISLTDFLPKLKITNADVTIALKHLKNSERYGSIHHDISGKLTAFKEKTVRQEGDINAGIYLLKTSFLKSSTNTIFSFETYIQEQIQDPSHSIYGHLFDAYFIDIGIPDDYYLAVNQLPELLFI